MCEELKKRKTYCLFAKEGAAPVDQAYAEMVRAATGKLPERQTGPVMPGTPLALAAELLTRLPGSLCVGDMRQVTDSRRGTGLMFSTTFEAFVRSDIRDAATRAGFEVEEQEAQ